MPSFIIKLPTFAALGKLPLLKRTRVFLRWVESQPARRRYRMWDSDNCALAQFGLALGLHGARGGATSVYVVFDEGVDMLDDGDVVIPFGEDATDATSTFGALATRLRKYIASQS